MKTRLRTTCFWGLWSTGVIEAITIVCRATTGMTAADIPASTHWLLRMHHMFWCVPLLVVLPFCWKSPPMSGRFLGLSAGLVISDLLHHFLVLPLRVGNTGWHWP